MPEFHPIRRASLTTTPRTLPCIPRVWGTCPIFFLRSGVHALVSYHQADPELQEAAGAIVDRFFGEDGYESSDEGGDEETDTETAVGGGEGFSFGDSSASTPFGGFRQQQQQPPPPPPPPQQQQQQQQQQPLAPLGRGSHLTRPAWMNQNPS